MARESFALSGLPFCALRLSSTAPPALPLWQAALPPHPPPPALVSPPPALPAPARRARPPPRPVASPPPAISPPGSPRSVPTSPASLPAGRSLSDPGETPSGSEDPVHRPQRPVCPCGGPVSRAPSRVARAPSESSGRLELGVRPRAGRWKASTMRSGATPSRISSRAMPCSVPSLDPDPAIEETEEIDVNKTAVHATQPVPTEDPEELALATGARNAVPRRPQCVFVGGRTGAARSWSILGMR